MPIEMSISLRLCIETQKGFDLQEHGFLGYIPHVQLFYVYKQRSGIADDINITDPDKSDKI